VSRTRATSTRAITTCGNKVERLKEESYYFRLSKYQQPLLDFYAANPAFVQPDFRFNEVRTFVEAGLQDLSISRTSFQWGIPVPGDPKHVMYVWFDALTNYLTALGLGSDDPQSTRRIDRFWPGVTHLIGKEILRQHALYWPAFLMAAGVKPPDRIVAHGWWLMGGAKMSKSLGNVARYQDYVDVFGVDGLRYFVMREMSLLGQDSNFSDDAILTRFNADLANDLGNLVSRTTTMIHRYSGGIVPNLPSSKDDLDAQLEQTLRNTISGVVGRFETFQISLALQETWDLVRSVNQYIVKREPWALAKRPDARPLLDGTLYRAADALRITAALIDPVMPQAAERIRGMLGMSQEPWGAGLKPGMLQSGTRLGETTPLFPRIEKTVEELRGMTSQENTASPAPKEEQRISIDEFMKVELRVAKVLEAEAVPKSKKLLKLKVDTGTDQRTIVAGIAEAYQPDQLVGRTIVIVANLQPAKLMGVESNGMVLAASPEGGLPILVSVDPSMPPGARVR
jgi:methionyl-tRNA synthetase